MLRGFNREADAADREANDAESPTVRGSVRSWGELVDRVLAAYYRQPILSVEQWQEEEERGRSQIRVLDPFLRSIDASDPAAAERDVYRGTLMRVDQEDAIRARVTEVVAAVPAPLRKTFARVLSGRTQPTYALDDIATERRRQEAFAAVEPVRGLPPPRRPARARRRRAGLRRAAPARRRAGRRTTRNGPRASGSPSRWASSASSGLLGLVPWLYLFQGSSRIVRNPVRGLTLTLLLLFGQAVSVLLAGVWPQALYGSGTFGTLLVVMILAVVYDRPFAIVAGTVHALLVTLSLGAGLPLLLVILTGTAAAALQLREVRTRSKLVIVGLFAGPGDGRLRAAGPGRRPAGDARRRAALAARARPHRPAWVRALRRAC